MAPKKKKRLDLLLQERMPKYSRRQIQSWIMQGKVAVDDKIINKAGTLIDEKDAIIKLDIEEPLYVSRAGFKLEKALNEFSIDVSGLVVLDAGISTGGFTDCLLQRGAKKVYGVDVGYGQLHEKIRNNPRLVLLERTNLRSLKDLDEKVDLITLDLSFISVLKVMDAVLRLLKKDGELIVLIKPQFEAGKYEVGRGGIVRNEGVRQVIVEHVVNGIKDYDFILKGLTESPILGAKGNKEFLAYFKREKGPN
ncbi:MAG: TlyA family RNA methyltransferase [Candidatus Babeliales bacterium]|jgi:23S rRNA (cytidine1920-2'-O)/16S rRNA (cytidine1409-2'-O)-methyltransferase